MPFKGKVFRTNNYARYTYRRNNGDRHRSTNITLGTTDITFPLAVNGGLRRKQIRRQSPSFRFRPSQRAWIANSISYEEGLIDSTVDATVVASAVNVIIGIDAPTLSSSPDNIVTTAVAVVVGIDSPTISVGIFVPTSAVAVVIGIGSPVITSSPDPITPASVAVVIGIGAPTVGTQTNVAPSSVPVTVGIGSPTITSSPTVTPASVPVVIGIPAPIVSISGTDPTPPSVAVIVGIGLPTIVAVNIEYAHSKFIGKEFPERKDYANLNEIN